MPHVSPSRFSAKTDAERKLYFLDWRNAIGSQAIESVAWSSHPHGLAFANENTSGTLTQVEISGGMAGTQYRVRCQVTLAGTGEVLEASENDTPGVPLEVLGFPVRSGGLGTLRDDYGRGPY